MSSNNNNNTSTLELTESMMVDLKKNFGNDPKQLDAYIKSLEETKRQDEDKKINELAQNFSSINRQEIVRVLKENHWNVEACFVPLIALNEQTKRKELDSKRKKDQEAQREKEKELRKKRMEQEVKELMDAFGQIPHDTILQLLEEHDGDIDAATGILLQMVEKIEQKKAEEKTKALKEQQEIKIRVLRDRFPDLTEKDLLDALKKNNNELIQTVNSLLSVQAQILRGDLQKLFPVCSPVQIDQALEKAKGDKAEAAKILNSLKPVEKDPKLAESKPAETKASQPPLLVQKVQEEIMHQSIMIVDAVNKEAQQILQEEQKETQKMFQEKLGEVVAAQCLHVMSKAHQVPGTNPPLSTKEIDVLLGKGPVVEEKPKQEKTESLPSPVAEGTSQVKLDTGVAVVLKASPAMLDVGGKVSVEYQITSGKSTSSDWIGLFPVSGHNKEYVTYQWRGKDDTKGTLTFASPTEYGEYEFRYFCNRSYAHVSSSNRFKVGPEIKMESRFSDDGKEIRIKWTQISGNTYNKSWIGLYRKQETNNKNYIVFDYATKIELTFPAPIKPGEYEFRYFTNSYVDVARSDTIRIEGEDKISGAYKDGMVHVDIDIVSVDPSTEKVWVGLYFVTEPSHKKFRRYQAVVDRKGTLSIKSPKTAGTYEARLFKNGTYDFVLKSNSFDIPNGH